MVLSPARKAITPFLFISCALVMLSSCIVRKAPANKPFVYKTEVTMSPDFTKEEQKILIPQLEQQLHDSIKSRWVRKYLVATFLEQPPVFDSLNAMKSLDFMSGLLHVNGYYRDSIHYQVRIDTVTVPDGNERAIQYRAFIKFNVVNGKLFKLDSISYDLLRDTSQFTLVSPSRDILQKLADSSRPGALIKKGDPFTIASLASEIGRLTDLYRNNGYLRFSNDELLVLWDTVGKSLLRPTLDPLEQAAQLEELRRRRANPTADVEFRLRTNEDTSRLIRYYVGNINVYPDLGPDTALYYPTIEIRRGNQFISYANFFNPKYLQNFVYLKKGDLYRQADVIRTQNRFSSLTAWRLVTVVPVTRPGSDTVDFDIKLSPSKKYQFTANLEGSRNQTPIANAIGTLLGIGVNVGIQNRNFARGANLSSTNFRYGVELNAGKSVQSPIQTQQFSLTHTILFPRKVPSWLRLPSWIIGKKEPNDDNMRTLLGLNLAYTKRANYYTVYSSITSWGYEKNWGNKLLGIRFPNIEYYYLNRGRELDTLIAKNNTFRYIFNKGLILSTIGNMTWAWSSNRNRSTTILTAGAEVSGLFAGLLPSKFLDSNLNRFIKGDIELRHTIRGSRNDAWAFRFYAGLGWGQMSSIHDSLNRFLPFFRQYFVGGPNSMRAWSIRRLGPGSSLESFDPDKAPDRFGDMRLEANAEYRFRIITFPAFSLNGAFYADMGNVWFLRRNENFTNGEFKLRYLWRDLAIGVGTGLRVDFSFLKLRFEYAYKAKNPNPVSRKVEDQKKWFPDWTWYSGQFQLGIDYPF